VRYDAAIIGAGVNGLAAAATLARAGFKTVVVERAQVCGGRAATRAFHPGFRASPWCDEIAPIPNETFRALDLARHGTVLLPTSSSLALWPDRRHRERFWAEPTPLRDEARARLEAIAARAAQDTARMPERGWFRRPVASPSWPGEDWASRTLADLADEWIAGDDARRHAVAVTASGRAVDPFRTGTALHLLCTRGSGVTMGGLATLAGALEKAARAEGVAISLGLEAGDVRLKGGRARGIALADGTEIEARAVISTLDLKRSFLSLFAWKDLPKEVAARVTAFRYAAATARLLIALDAPPDLPAGPIHIAPDAQALAAAFAAWRAGTLPEHPPLSLRLVSADDPSLAPTGRATMTATLGAIPHLLFDGAWTHEKRTALRNRALAGIEAALPGISARVLAIELIVPPDIEEALGASEGDLDGGEIAPDQMFARRCFPDLPGGRTPIPGFYLAGALAPHMAAAPGVTTAQAVAADLKAGRLK
jgi:phytoene dehydrogenase-like protein